MVVKEMAAPDAPSPILTFKYRLLTTRRQHRALEKILEDQRQLYNAALTERMDCYAKTGVGRTYVDQCKSLTEWRSFDQEAAATPPNIQRWTLKRVDDSYRAFFRRLKSKSGRVGFPRFRGKGWWNSFGFNEFSGIKFDGKRVRFSSIPGGVRVHLHRSLPAGRPLACVFTRDTKGWAICFQMKTSAAEPQKDGCAIGVDFGLSVLATLSDGTPIPNVRHSKRAEVEMRRRQRALSRCKKGSARRAKIKTQVARRMRKIADARATHLHQVSANLVGRFGLIVIEKLNVKGMASGTFAKSINDASWGKLRQMLVYKAERAGSRVVEVNPWNTSQACSCCGVVVPKPLSARVHECTDCGTVLDRDHNAALNILRLGVVAQGALNVTDCGERAPRNIASPGKSLPIRRELPITPTTSRTSSPSAPYKTGQSS